MLVACKNGHSEVGKVIDVAGGCDGWARERTSFKEVTIAKSAATDGDYKVVNVLDRNSGRIITLKSSSYCLADSNLMGSGLDSEIGVYV